MGRFWSRLRFCTFDFCHSRWSFFVTVFFVPIPMSEIFFYGFSEFSTNKITDQWKPTSTIGTSKCVTTLIVVPMLSQFSLSIKIYLTWRTTKMFECLFMLVIFRFWEERAIIFWKIILYIKIYYIEIWIRGRPNRTKNKLKSSKWAPKLSVIFVGSVFALRNSSNSSEKGSFGSLRNLFAVLPV